MSAKVAYPDDRLTVSSWKRPDVQALRRGKEVGGVQAGLGFRPGEHRAYHTGETARLVVRVRNVGKKEVKLSYFNEFFYEQPPAVTDGKGKQVPLEGFGFGGEARLVEVSLPPGREINLCEMNLELRAGNGRPVWTLYGTGKFQLHYENVGGGNIGTGEIKFDPTLNELGTGKLEIQINPGDPLLEKGKANDKPPAAEKSAKAPLQQEQKVEAKPKTDKTDNDKLRGKWRVLEIVTDGKPNVKDNPDDEADAIITGDTMVLVAQPAGKKFLEFTIKLDATKGRP